MVVILQHFQQEHSHTCGVSAIRMILSQFGNVSNEKELLSGITIHSYGIYSTELAIPLLKKDYQATAYTFNLPILGRYNLPDNSPILPSHLESALKQPSLKIVATNMLDFLSAGGRLIWKAPSIDLLQEQIINGLTPLISVNTAALGDYWRHWNNGHYLVVTEVNDFKVYVHDPYYPKEKGVYEISNDRLMAAWIVNSTRSTDHCLLISKS